MRLLQVDDFENALLSDDENLEDYNQDCPATVIDKIKSLSSNFKNPKKYKLNWKIVAKLL